MHSEAEPLCLAPSVALHRLAPVALPRQRALLATAPTGHWLTSFFRSGVMPAWELGIAETFEQARFVLQHDHYDVLLLEGSSLADSDGAVLTRLAAQRDIPALLLTDMEPTVVIEALASATVQWLPRELVRQHPAVLAAALGHALKIADERKAARAAGDEVNACRRQVSRLLDRLWESTPTEARFRIVAQRHVMERLEEEVHRAKRYPGALSIVLVEVHPQDEDAAPLSVAVADCIVRAKRRCDVAGYYGPNAFLVVLVHTPHAGALTFSRRLIALIHQTLGVGSFAAFGMATFAVDTATPAALLSRAEARLEDARRSLAESVVA